MNDVTSTTYIEFVWIYVGEGTKPFDDDLPFGSTYHGPFNWSGIRYKTHEISQIAKTSLREVLVDKRASEIVQYAQEHQCSVDAAIDNIVPLGAEEDYLLIAAYEALHGVGPDNAYNLDLG